MGISTKITDLTVWDTHSQPEQLAAFTDAMIGRKAYAFSHAHLYLRVTPEGELHQRILTDTESPDTHPVLNDKSKTQLWAKIPSPCDPSAALKSQGRLKFLLEQLHTAYISGHTGPLKLRWSSEARPTFEEWMEDMGMHTPRPPADHPPLTPGYIYVPLSA